jgi:hypothetical protein
VWLADRPAQAALDVRERQKSMRSYPSCWVAGEGVEWLRRWLRGAGFDCSLSITNRVFTALLHSRLFEIVSDPEQQAKADSSSPTASAGAAGSSGAGDFTLADAFVFCRFVAGGGSSLLNVAAGASERHHPPLPHCLAYRA